MYINEIKTKDENKKIFEIEVYTNSRATQLNVKLDSIFKKLKSKFNIEDYDFLPGESSGNLSKSARKGIYVFKKKAIDIINDSVTIDKIIEAESPLLEEQVKEASLPSKTLPYGLKSTAKKTTAKKRRTTKKKTIEE